MGEVGEIVREFLVESCENPDQPKQGMASLESGPGSKELPSSIFRIIHTTEGTSDFLAFNRLEKPARCGESLLSELRDGMHEMNQETADMLLSMVDHIHATVGLVKEAGQEGDVDIGSVIAQIEAIQDKTESVAKPTTEQAPHETEETPAEVPFMTNVPDGKGGTSVGEPTEAPSITDVPDEKGQTSIDAEALVVQAETEPKPAPARPTQSADVAVITANSKKDTKSAGYPTSDHRYSATESSIRADIDLPDVLTCEVSELVLVHN